MADLDIRNRNKITDKRVGRGVGASTTASDADFKDITAMRTKLKSLSAVLYTDKQLDKMTHNDMVYAIRLGTTDKSAL